MGKPAARVGDTHICPKMNPGLNTPHVGGVIIGSGNASVLIGGMPAATVGDSCACESGEPNSIIIGSTGVFIGGKPAAREGDACAHGGKVNGGLGSVLIGGRKTLRRSLVKKIKTIVKEQRLRELTMEEKNKQIITAVGKCIVLLERKLELLGSRDEKTMEEFEKWFGVLNEYEVQTIIYRIQNALNVAYELTIDSFTDIVNEHTRMYSAAMVWSTDEFHTIYLGDWFWNEEQIKERPQELVLVHELSHFDYVGMTWDFEYGVEQCLDLTKHDHEKALFNAESFESFIKS